MPPAAHTPAPTRLARVTSAVHDGGGAGLLVGLLPDKRAADWPLAVSRQCHSRGGSGPKYFEGPGPSPSLTTLPSPPLSYPFFPSFCEGKIHFFFTKYPSPHFISLQKTPHFISCLRACLPSFPLEVGPLNTPRVLEERCKLPQRGVGHSPSRDRILCILAL